MALTEPNRSVVFRGLSNLLESEEATVEMMSVTPGSFSTLRKMNSWYHLI